MFETLQALDRELFLLINSYHSDAADVFMSFVSKRLVWIPLYAGFLLLAIKTYPKRVWPLLVSIALLIIASDQLSVLIKNSVERYRPCHNLEISHLINLFDGCGGKFGFVSSHAANTFGLALFLSLFFKDKLKWFPWFIFTWAFVICYSRIYLGVHYPADIIGGAMLGMVLSAIAFSFYRKLHTKYIRD